MNKVVLNLLFLFLFSNFITAQITYQGPEKGSISGGATVSTDDFTFTKVLNQNKFSVIIHQSPGELIDVNAQQSTFDKNLIYHVDQSTIQGKSVGEKPIIIAHFQGLDDPGGYIPPDPYIAAGPNHLMQVDNSRFRITDKQGNDLATINADNWFASTLTGASVFDCKVSYDHFDGRWFMVWLHVNDAASESYYMLSVSDDDNPMGTWFNWAIPSNTNGDSPSGNWADYQGVGFDSKAIYLTSNMFSFSGGYEYSKIRLIPKENVYIDANPGFVEWTDFWDISYPNSSSFSFGIRPARSMQDDGFYYFVTASPFVDGQDLGLYELTDPLGSPSITGVRVPTITYNSPTNAEQLGGGTPALDGGGRHVRFEPIYQNNMVHVVHTIAAAGSGSDLHYVAIDAVAGSAANEVVFGSSGYYHTYSTLAVTEDDDVVMTYSRSSAQEYMGSYYTVIPFATGIPVTSFMLDEGKANYVKDFQSGRNRWGDYNGAWVDPADPKTVWLMTEYVAGANKWGNSVAGVRVEPFENAYARKLTDEIDFSVHDLGTLSETAVVRIANVGAQTLNILSAATDTDQFEVLGEPSEWTVESLDTLEILIRYNPTQLGSVEDVLTLTTNDLLNPELTVTLKGNGFGIASANKIYAVTQRAVGWQGTLLTINTSTADVETIGESGFNPLMSLTVNPIDKKLYVLSTTAFTPSTIYKISSFDGLAYPLFEAELDIAAMAFDLEGTLYVATEDNKLFTLDIETQESTFIADLDVAVKSMTVNPINGEFWISVDENSEKDRIYKLNEDTGALTLIGSTGTGSKTEAISFDWEGKLFGVVGTGVQISTLYEIDTTTGVATEIGATPAKAIGGMTMLYDPSTDVEDEIRTIVPKDFNLAQNYPNPFNPSTQIKFSLPVVSDVKIDVFNSIGERVTQLIDSKFNAGVHTVEFNSSSFGNLSSGIYIYRITAVGVNGKVYSDSRKMMLIK